MNRAVSGAHLIPVRKVAHIWGQLLPGSPERHAGAGSCSRGWARDTPVRWGGGGRASQGRAAPMPKLTVQQPVCCAMPWPWGMLDSTVAVWQSCRR